jgi:RNA polymerase sigma-70 factor (ECF subfamily)
MTASSSPDPALYWNEALADELLHFLTGRLKCAETAADITHETFLRLYESAKENPPDNARAMAYRIAINLATDYQRKIKVRSNYAADIESTELAETQPSAVPGPEQIVIAQQQLDIVQAALDELPADCRVAFLLHGIDGLTHPEIAVRLGISRSKVYRHLVKALAHCVQSLGDAT